MKRQERSGKAEGMMLIATDDKFHDQVGSINIIKREKKVCKVKVRIKQINGVKPLYFKFIGNGIVDFISFELMGGD